MTPDIRAAIKAAASCDINGRRPADGLESYLAAIYRTATVHALRELDNLCVQECALPDSARKKKRREAISRAAVRLAENAGMEPPKWAMEVLEQGASDAK